MPPFHSWVADTVEAVSGIRPRVIACDSRKRALTCELSRAAVCQVVPEDYFWTQRLMLALLNSEVSARKHPQA